MPSSGEAGVEQGSAMELGRQLLAKMRKKKKTDHTCLLGPKGLEVHFYTPASQPLIKFRGCHTVEELCIECAKQFGELFYEIHADLAYCIWILS